MIQTSEASENSYSLDVHRGKLKEDKTDLIELREQINKIQKIKNQYETQRIQIRQLNQSLAVLQSQNIELKSSCKENFAKKDQELEKRSCEVQTILNSKRDKSLMTDNQYNDNLRLQNLQQGYEARDLKQKISKEKQQEENNFDQLSYRADEFYQPMQENKRKTKKNKSLIEYKAGYYDVVEDAEASCPDQHCKYEKMPEHYNRFRVTKNTFRSASPLNYERNLASPKFKRHDNYRPPQKDLIENFINQLKHQLYRKNLQIEGEESKQRQYKEYLQICRQENRKLLQMNNKIWEKHDIMCKSNELMKTQLTKQIEDKYKYQTQFNSLHLYKQQTRKRWDNEFDKMDKIYQRFENIIGKYDAYIDQ